MSEKVLNLSEESFEKEVMQSESPVLVDFWASWCGPCRMLAPTIEELAADYEGKVKVCKVNVDEAEGVARQFGIMTIPTVILFKGGQEMDKSIGLVNKSALSAMIDKHI